MYRIAILFILIGFSVKYGKMYFLISGYNTMSKAGKATVNIEKLAALFGNVFFAMGAMVLLGSLADHYLAWPEFGNFIFIPTLLIGVVYISFSRYFKKYRRRP